MRRILIQLPAEPSASSYYRAMLPFRHCKKTLASEGIELVVAEGIFRGDHWDAIIAHREVDIAYIQHIASRQVTGGCKFVWDLDDDFWAIPEWSPVKYSADRMDCINLTFKVCDEVWASTSPLAKKLGWKAKVLPNLIDLNDWGGGWMPPEEDESGVTRVLWAGSNTHSRDVAITVDPILKSISGDEGNHVAPKYHFHFFGYCPPDLMANLFPNHITYHPWVPLNEFHEVLWKIRPHIVLCPLADCTFNESKSNIRWMEGVMAGGAAITSKCESYKDASNSVPQDSNVETRNNTWLYKLNCLTFHHYRLQYWKDDKKSIVLNHTWQSKVNVWLDAFRGLVK